MAPDLDAADAPGRGRAVPVYPVVASAAFFTFFSSTGAAFFAEVGAGGVGAFRLPEDFAASRAGMLEAPGRLLGTPGRLLAMAFRLSILVFVASSAFISLRSFIVILRSTVLCWILPSDSRSSEPALARAIISAYDRFFGGPESVGLGRLASGRAGNGLLAFEDVVPAPLNLEPVAAGFLSRVGRGFTGCLLSLEPPRGRSAGRADGFGGTAVGRYGLSATGFVRATFGPVERSSSSALRLGKGTLGRATTAGAGDGSSPVIDARRSKI